MQTIYPIESFTGTEEDNTVESSTSGNGTAENNGAGTAEDSTLPQE